MRTTSATVIAPPADAGGAGCHCCGMLCLPSAIDDYRQCGGCGAWRSMRPEPPEQLYDAAWWSHEQGHSTMREQWNNLTLPFHVAEPFVTAWTRYAVAEKPPGSRLLEIGCCPGAFLYTMAVKGYDCVGQEATAGICREMSELTRMPPKQFVDGLFPQTAPPGPFDLIAAFDVLEHALDPHAWLVGALELLADDGVLLLQMPVFDPDVPADMAAENRRMWQADEHVYVFTPTSLQRLLQRCGQSGDYERTRLAPGHDLIVVRKR